MGIVRIFAIYAVFATILGAETADVPALPAFTPINVGNERGTQENSISKNLRAGVYTSREWLSEWDAGERPSVLDASFIRLGSALDEFIEVDFGFSAKNSTILTGFFINPLGAKKLTSALGVNIEIGLAIGPVVSKSFENGAWSWGIAVIPLTFKF